MFIIYNILISLIFSIIFIHLLLRYLDRKAKNEIGTLTAERDELEKKGMQTGSFVATFPGDKFQDKMTMSVTISTLPSDNKPIPKPLWDTMFTTALESGLGANVKTFEEELALESLRAINGFTVSYTSEMSWEQFTYPSDDSGQNSAEI